MEEFIQKAVSLLWGTPLIVTILGTGLFFTVASGFFQIRFFKHIMKETFGKLIKKDKTSKGEKGILSPFEAISIAIGGSVGVGNIGGVATAIAVGGPGAVFWLWVAALLGTIIKMVEVTLAVHYRTIDEEGNPYGGPSFYMEKGLGEEKKLKLWIVPAILFGGGILSTFFITLQNYTVSEAISSTFDVSMILVAFIYAILVYIMINGGIPGLGKIASKTIPFMCLFYIVSGLFIILKNITFLPETIALIFEGAFTGTAAVGGFAGAAFMQVLKIGMSRSVYSNEAGWGTSPMIHSTAKTDHPIRQGFWGAFEVFVDTGIVCTITALIIIITGNWCSGATSATLTLSAFESGMGYLGRVILSIGVFLFGITTTTGWYTYYEILLRHASKDNVKAKKAILKFYKYCYPIPGFLMVVMAVVKGLPGQIVWLFGDFTSAIPTFINVIVILILSKRFFELLKDYKARYLGIGKVDPDFKPFYEDRKKEK
ncbi:alanine/glycine:cation symporter family protein [Clostridium senegalense]|uniref:Sodium:alanine symporter family protein n=1 Tax=Clostridium senegalense TaxID=1465809 RepID=A0A6M0H4D2_9CLOT|nr:amino acid carrier protein [Clostridium senegalense]NEU05138.1 sodium:alanine symporter family protein [Clostridium senegalense]